jgi:hypothetical protein
LTSLWKLWLKLIITTISGRWRNKKLMPREKIIDNSKDSIKLINNKNIH